MRRISSATWSGGLLVQQGWGLGGALAEAIKKIVWNSVTLRALSCALLVCTVQHVPRLVQDKHDTASGTAVRCILPLPSVPGRPRGQWPRVPSQWHHAAFYQWLQWHTAPAGRLPGARCPRLGWEWHQRAARVKRGIQNNNSLSVWVG